MSFNEQELIVLNRYPTKLEREVAAKRGNLIAHVVIGTAFLWVLWQVAG